MSVRHTPTDERVAQAALGWIGTPYRHQGSLKGVGCDCLGLVRGVWRELYGREPETAGAYAPDWDAGGVDLLTAAADRHCIRLGAAMPARGDLVLFAWRPELPARHAGIALGPDSFVHAYQGRAVLVSALVPQWRRRIAGLFAFPEIPPPGLED